MPKLETVERIERDIEAGNLGLARDRLLGLIGSYPDDLALRVRLAEIYWKLQDPIMAGRYWYLEAQPSDEMVSAIDAFEKSCGHQAWRILSTLKVRVPPDKLDDTYARQRLLDLVGRCSEWEQSRCLPWRVRTALDRELEKEKVRSQSRFWNITCLVTLAIMGILMILGIVFLVTLVL